MTRVDPTLGDYMAQLRRQAANRKIRSFEMIEKENSIVPIDVVPATTIVPPVNRKMGRPAKTV